MPPQGLRPDASPDVAQGPYPLVLFSPGLAGWRQAHSYLLEHLAAYGLVDIASDPRGETFEEFWQGAATRLSLASNPDVRLAGLIKLDPIATQLGLGWTGDAGIG